MQIIDEDTVNTVNKENYAYTLWEREKKNKILAMSDSVKKQEVWRKYFPLVERSDEWMLSAQVF